MMMNSKTIEKVGFVMDDIMEPLTMIPISKELSNNIFQQLSERLSGHEIVVEQWRDYCITANVLLSDGTHLIRQIVRES